MLKHTISYCEGNTFFEKQVFKLKVNNGIRECEAIKETLKKAGEVRKEDFKLNIIIPSNRESRRDMKYLITKGYNKDGTLKPIKKYKYEDGRVIEEDKNINTRIMVLDLYEKSIYLYNYDMDEEYISGYLVREEKSGKGNDSLIFTREKVKVFQKNVNAFHEYMDLDTFMDKFMM